MNTGAPHVKIVAEPLPLVALASQKSGMVLHFLCFYGHPTLRDWFISEWSDWERAGPQRKEGRQMQKSLNAIQ